MLYTAAVKWIRLVSSLPFLALAGFGIATGTGSSGPSVRFEEISSQAEIRFRHISGGPAKDFIVESKGGGVTVLDFDGDGWLDIYLVSGSTFEIQQTGITEGRSVPRNALYRNNGNGTFRDVSSESETDDPGWGMGASSADYDNDGDADLYVANYGMDILFRNNGDGTFRNVNREAGLSVPGWSTGSAWGDYDRDGDLDLYVARYIDFKLEEIPPKGANDGCQYRGIAVQCGPMGLKALPDILFRNEGDGTFVDVTGAALGADQPRYYSFTPIWADFDRDGWLDLFVACDSTPNLYYRNRGDGTFEDLGALSGTAYSRDAVEQSGMGADIADYDHDGLLDIFVANFSEDYNTLYRNLDESFFEDVTVNAQLGRVSWAMVGFGLKFLDFDLDGWKDAFVVNGHVYPGIQEQTGAEYKQHPQILWNRRDGTFSDITEIVGGDLLQKRVGRGAAFGDLDNDGDVDVVVNNLDDQASVFECHPPPNHHWMVLKLQGVKSNRDGVGTVIRVRSGSMEQVQPVYQAGGFLSGNDLRSHFGLGENRHAERVEIQWPSGLSQTFENLPADRFIKIVEGEAQPIYLDY